MAEQLRLPLPVVPARGRADFFVSDANAQAVRAVEQWRGWPHGKLVLTGPEGAGKTHLVHVWAGLAGARILGPDTLGDAVAAPRIGPCAVEDVDRLTGRPASETALFHLHNRLASARQPLLLTGRGPPACWPLRLPDLASRIAQARMVALADPDDALLAAVLAKIAADRQLAIGPELIGWAIPRIERSFAGAAAFLDALDAEALERRRRPSTDTARHALARLAAARSPMSSG